MSTSFDSFQTIPVKYKARNLYPLISDIEKTVRKTSTLATFVQRRCPWLRGIAKAGAEATFQVRKKHAGFRPLLRW